MKMKRAIAALTVLCGGLLVINPVANIFAQGPNNNQVIQEVQTIENSTNKEIIKNEAIIKEDKNEESKVEAKKEEILKEEISKEDTYKKEDVTVNNIDKEQTKENDIEIKEQVESDVIVKEEEAVEDDQSVVEETIKEEVKEENVVEVIDVLNQDEAKELLQMYKKDVEFAYQGDESAFGALAQKGLSGYVFLPDYPTDLGFFVDKNTASIYYFHPSGYLELAL